MCCEVASPTTSRFWGMEFRAQVRVRVRVVVRVGNVCVCVMRAMGALARDVKVRVCVWVGGCACVRWFVKACVRECARACECARTNQR